MKKKHVLLVAIVVFGLLFYQIYFKDYLAYKEVEKIQTEEACQNYFYQFPEGYFTEDVHFIELNIVKKIKLIRQFMEFYPDSKYKSRVYLIKDGIWNEKIDIYKAKIWQSAGNQEAVDFFTSLLNYMRDRNEYNIGFNFRSKLELKDFNDYSKSVKDLLNENYKLPPLQGELSRFVPDSLKNKRSLEDCVLPLRSSFSQGAISELEGIVSKGIQQSVDSIFSPGFISIIQDTTATNLMIKVGYYIKSQEFNLLYEPIPILWEYRENGILTFYVQGISIDFKFDFILPQSGLRYHFENQFDPTEDIKDITGIEDGYGRMTRMVFEKFSNNISAEFGLDKSYKTE